MLAPERVTELTATLKRLAAVAPSIVALKAAFQAAGLTEDRAHTYTLALIANVLAVPSQPELPQAPPSGG